MSQVRILLSDNMQLMSCMSRSRLLLCIPEVAYEHIDGSHRKKAHAEGPALSRVACAVGSGGVWQLVWSGLQGEGFRRRQVCARTNHLSRLRTYCDGSVGRTRDTGEVVILALASGCYRPLCRLFAGADNVGCLRARRR